jgi:hypothetical protein
MTPEAHYHEAERLLASQMPGPPVERMSWAALAHAVLSLHSPSPVEAGTVADLAKIVDKLREALSYALDGLAVALSQCDDPRLDEYVARTQHALNINQAGD